MKAHSIKRLAQVISLSVATASTMVAADTLKLMTSVVGGKTPDEHTRFVEYVGEELGLDVTITKPSGSFDQVMMTTLASGERYDLLNITTRTLDILVAQGALMDMTAMIQESDRLSDNEVIPEGEWDLIERDGKIYGVPNKFEGGTLPIVRADWLEAMDMDTPVTLEDWYAYFKGANEKYNAYGLTVAGLYDIQGFMSAKGVKAGYVIDEDGNRTIPYATEAAAEMYDWFAQLYKEGLLDPSFATNGGGDMVNQFLSDQTATVGYWDMWVGLYNNIRQLQDPETTFRAQGVAGVPGEDGKIMLRRGDSSIWVIPANAENPDNAMRFLEFWHSEKGYLLGTLGLEGEHYTVENGKYTLTEAGEANGMDHGAPRVSNRNWEHPIGYADGVAEAEALILEHASVEHLPEDWTRAQRIVERYAFQAMTGRISGEQAVQQMQRNLKRSNLIDA